MRDGHRRRRLLVPRPEQLREEQRRRQLPERDDGGRLRLRLPVHPLGNVAMPNFKGADPRSPANSRRGTATTCRCCSSTTTKRMAPCRAGSPTGGSAHWIRSPTPTRRKPGQEPQAVAHLQQDHLSLPVVRITFDGLNIRGNFAPTAGAAATVFISLTTRRRTSSFATPTFRDGRGHRCAGRRIRARAEPDRRELLSAKRHQHNVATNWSVNGCWMEDKLVVIRNTRFERRPGRSLTSPWLATSAMAGVPEQVG